MSSFYFIISCFLMLIVQNQMDNHYPFIKYDQSIIHSGLSFNEIFKKYDREKKLNILHIGDSHLVLGDWAKGFIEKVEEKFVIGKVQLRVETIKRVPVKKNKRYRYIYKKFIKTKQLRKSNPNGINYFVFAASGKGFYFFEKSEALKLLVNSIKPDLIIISLGTNDAISNYSDEKIYSLISSLYNKFNNSKRQFLFISQIEFIKNNVNGEQ